PTVGMPFASSWCGFHVVPVRKSKRLMPSTANVEMPRCATMATSVTTRSATSAMHAPVTPLPTSSTRRFGTCFAIAARLLSLLEGGDVSVRVLLHLHAGHGDVALRLHERGLHFVAHHVVDERLRGLIGLGDGVHVLVGPDGPGVVLHVLGRGVHAVHLERLEGVIIVGERHVGAGTRGGGHHL